ncbi:MAG TPA: putative Ig domain-containing protein, partial [Acidimicrobiales bacterium]|nr:putative Ig domain-containing protein [Acidimicrobiales bacterium]
GRAWLSDDSATGGSGGDGGYGESTAGAPGGAGGQAGLGVTPGQPGAGGKGGAAGASGGGGNGGDGGDGSGGAVYNSGTLSVTSQTGTLFADDDAAGGAGVAGSPGTDGAAGGYGGQGGFAADDSQGATPQDPGGDGGDGGTGGDGGDGGNGGNGGAASGGALCSETAFAASGLMYLDDLASGGGQGAGGAPGAAGAGGAGGAGQAKAGKNGMAGMMGSAGSAGTDGGAGQGAHPDACLRSTLQPVTVNTTSLPSGTVGSAYSATLRASGGTAPYHYSIASGSLPPGLALSGATISGKPTAAGSYPMTIEATESSSPQIQGFKALTLTVAAGSTSSTQTTSTQATAQTTTTTSTGTTPALPGPGRLGASRPKTSGEVVHQTVSCSGTGDCHITVQLSVTETLLGNKLVALGARHKKTKRVVVIGHTSVTLVPGAEKTVTLKPNGAGLKLLAKHRRVRAALTDTEAGSTARSGYTVTLTRSKAKKKKS